MSPEGTTAKHGRPVPVSRDPAGRGQAGERHGCRSREGAPGADDPRPRRATLLRLDGIRRLLRRGHLRGDRRGEEEAGDGGAPPDGCAQAGGGGRGADLPDAGVRAGVREARAARGAAAPHPRGFRGSGAVREREEHASHPPLPGNHTDRQRERHGGHRGDPPGGKRGGGERSPGDAGDPDDRGGPADPAHRQRRSLHERSPPAPDARRIPVVRDIDDASIRAAVGRRISAEGTGEWRRRSRRPGSCRRPECRS